MPVPLKTKSEKNLCTCGKKPVFYRRYEGRYYCKACFCESFEKKVKKTIAKYKLIEKGDRIAFGLSGGKDSSAVLYLLHKILSPRRDIKMFAISMDEGIAGYRNETLKKAKELCKSLGVKHHIFSFKDILGKPLDKKIIERGERDYCTLCGVGRRYVLNLAARKLKATKLCLGHNLDDEAQAVLMNFFRGDLLRAGRLGTKTDAALSEKHGNLFIPRIKPLRFIPEKEVTLYAVLKKLPYSDLECPYAQGMRFDVRDFLNEMENKHPGMKFALLEGYDKIVPAISKAVQYKGKLSTCKKCGEPTSHEICKTCQLWKV